MALITLIGELQAKVGSEFIYIGPQHECRDCRLKGVCLHLDPGKRYRVRGKRDVRHVGDCKLHEEGVRVVEVEVAPIETSFHVSKAVEGSVTSFDYLNCGNLACDLYRFCHPLGFQNGVKVKLTRVGDNIDCPEGFKIKRVVMGYA